MEILAEGDHVNELMVVVSGLVELRRPSEWMGKYDAQESIMNPEGKSIYLGSRCPPSPPSSLKIVDT